ncbi:hypothetical protein A7D17_01310 [Xanthomonas floridensis]|uniref:Uncharacterized protein n=1 Tax=Xanthomonas floridensis TaxID=1843580 RepID=A0A1A9MGW8_9XANT|nr:hypothetical protein A7D17_01310 [Xanthomonas floridensis]
MATAPVALPFGRHQRMHTSTRVHLVAHPGCRLGPLESIR